MAILYFEAHVQEDRGIQIAAEHYLKGRDVIVHKAMRPEATRTYNYQTLC